MLIKFLVVIPFVLNIQTSWSRSDKTKFLNKCGSFSVVSFIENDVPLIRNHAGCNLTEDIINESKNDKNGVIEIQPQEEYSRKWYKTSGSQTLLKVDPGIIQTVESTQDIIDKVLLDIIEKKIKENFDKATTFVESEKDKDLINAVSKARKVVFEKGLKNNRQKIRRYLALFEGLETQLIAEDPSLKPLFCQYEVWKHRQNHYKKIGQMLGTIATIGGIAGIIAASILNLPLLPVVFYSISALKFSGAAITTRDAIIRFSDYSAGTAAKRILKLQSQVKDKVIDLQNEKIKMKKLLDPIKLSAANEKAKKDEGEILTNNDVKLRINDLDVQIKKYNQSINEVEVYKKDLENAVDGRKAIRKDVIGAALNTTIGIGTFKVGSFLNDKFSDFRSDEVTPIHPYDPNPNPGDVTNPFDLPEDP
jgi:uncharacterized protein YqgV (UPF0045/DUF77 family)